MDWYVDTTRQDAVIAVKAEIGAYLRRHADDPDSVPDAEVAVSELIGNVARHAGGPAWVSLSWVGRHPELTVYDLGPGFVLDIGLPDDNLAEGGRGLFIVSHLVDALSAAARRGGGTAVSARLALSRTAAATYDPPLHHGNALPDLEEATPSGGFGKESFLRALVIQLAQAVEATHGPEAAEAAVAQVGADVGGQMELEYRNARQVVGRMTPERMADCYVRLKHAIDGDFYVIEANERRIVLGNNRCPFGELVRRAPALCRMTSSVFGGIAARNNDGEVALVLEERIAVGDPGCRVAVILDGSVDDAGIGHRYRAPSVSPAGDGPDP